MEEGAIHRTFWDIGSEGGVLHNHLPWLVEGLEWLAAVIDLVAIILLLVGALRFVVGVGRSQFSRDENEQVHGMNRERVDLGRHILAALELLIVSDIIHTALTLAIGDLVFLGLLVIIRSLISFFLDREMEQIQAQERERGEAA